MVAAGILCVTAVTIMNALSQVQESKQLSLASDVIFERDQMVKFEIATTLDMLQHTFLAHQNMAQFDENQNPNQGSSLCKSYTSRSGVWRIWDYLKFSQQNFAPLRPRNLYFGSAKDLISEDSIDRGIFSNLNALIKTISKEGDVSNGKLESRPSMHHSVDPFLKAITRCRVQSIGKETSDLSAKKSLYLCGYGHKLLVELKAVFWDDLESKSISCSQMPGRPGRSFQVSYQTFAYSAVQYKGKNSALIRSYGGQMFIPKLTSTVSDDPSRGLWDY